MKISITLHKSKELSNGEHPVLIRVFHDGKYKTVSTGVSTKEKYWNTKSNTVSSKDRDYKRKNKSISEKYETINDRTKQCLTEYGFLDWNLIISNRNIISDTEKENIKTFSELVEAKIRTSFSYGYQKNFIQLRRFVLSNLGDMPLSKLNQDFYNRFLESISNKTDAMKTKLMKHFIILCNFAYENGYIRKKINCKQIKYYSNRVEKSLTPTEFSTIISFYKKEVQSGAFNIDDIENYDYALGIFILMIAFQGIAPVDISQLKVKDIEIETLNSIDYNIEEKMNNPEYEDYYKNNNRRTIVVNVPYHRTKTGVKVDICTDYFSIEPIINCFCRSKNENDYIINCLDANKSYTDKQMKSRISNWFTEQVKVLNTRLKDFCINNDLQTIKHITYYMARHTFVNTLNDMDISHNKIRKLIGHIDNTLERNYISKADKIEQAEIIASIFNKEVTVKELYERSKITV